VSPQALQIQQQLLAQSMLQGGMQSTPIRSPWEGAARVAQAMIGGNMMRQAWEQQGAIYGQGIAEGQGLKGGGQGQPGYVSEQPHQTSGGPDLAHVDPAFMSRINQLRSRFLRSPRARGRTALRSYRVALASLRCVRRVPAQGS
jgi:hypothetical protein